MGAVNQTVDPELYQKLQEIRDRASEESEDSRWNLEYVIDKRVAEVITSAGIRPAIEAAIQQIIIDWKRLHPEP
jgi:hypothetical protein